MKQFNPSAYGQEKFMNYGIMMNLSKTDYIPMNDFWMTGEYFNYYYFGHIVAVIISKLSFVGIPYAFNLMIATIQSLASILVFSLVYNIVYLKSKNKKQSFFSGILSSMSSFWIGNIHYVIYGLFIPLINKIVNLNIEEYWFADSTRFVGTNQGEDCPINEIPSYASIVGDCHAHYMNMIFVVTFLAILFAFIYNNKNKLIDINNKKEIFKNLFSPYILLLGMFLGYFKGSNLWDMVIYFVVMLITCSIYNFKYYKLKIKNLIFSISQILISFIFGQLLVLPYTLSFNNPITKIGLVNTQTPLYKFIILWGFPIICILIGLFFILKNSLKNKNIKTIDIFCIIISICALGLIITPEIIYIDDIYEDIYERANTVYKMTYQAFILFGICIGIYIPELFIKKKKLLSVFLSTFLILSFGYYINLCNAWYSDFNINKETFNATYFLYNNDTFENDKYIIDYINNNIKEEVVIAEAVGNAYTNESRISVLTGNPTILGWSAHEWGWRGSPELILIRNEDVFYLYNGTVEQIEDIIDKYNIDYIYYGEVEINKYPYAKIENILELCTIEMAHRDINNETIIYYLFKVKK
jgi:uncharacterized membrane protein